MRLPDSEKQKEFRKKGYFNMKRAFAIMLALAMVLSLSATAFAAGGTGSITITNATVDETYAIYKIFDATFAVGLVSTGFATLRVVSTG